jgi:hypothetical protein
MSIIAPLSFLQSALLGLLRAPQVDACAVALETGALPAWEMVPHQLKVPLHHILPPSLETS